MLLLLSLRLRRQCDFATGVGNDKLRRVRGVPRRVSEQKSSFKMEDASRGGSLAAVQLKARMHAVRPREAQCREPLMVVAVVANGR